MVKYLIVKYGFMAHKPVPIVLPDNDILHDDEDCPHLDKITDYLKNLASKTSKTVSFKTRVPILWKSMKQIGFPRKSQHLVAFRS